MDKNKYIDWLDWNYNELVKEFIANKGEEFHKYCEEEYNNSTCDIGDLYE
jgi:hypothetical protein